MFLKGEVHPDIKLFLIEAEKWEEAGQCKFEQILIKIKKSYEFWICDQSNKN